MTDESLPAPNAGYTYSETTIRPGAIDATARRGNAGYTFSKDGLKPEPFDPSVTAVGDINYDGPFPYQEKPNFLSTFPDSQQLADALRFSPIEFAAAPTDPLPKMQQEQLDRIEKKLDTILTALSISPLDFGSVK